MRTPSIDPFFVAVGKAIGVEPSKIRVTSFDLPDFTCGGPKPKSFDNFPPDFPRDMDFCFSFVIEIGGPKFLCQAWSDEYQRLKAGLQALIDAEAWDDLAVAAARLSELKALLEGVCKPRARVITYCIFEDPGNP